MRRNNRRLQWLSVFLMGMLSLGLTLGLTQHAIATPAFGEAEIRILPDLPDDRAENHVGLGPVYAPMHAPVYSRPAGPSPQHVAIRPQMPLRLPVPATDPGVWPGPKGSEAFVFSAVVDDARPVVSSREEAHVIRYITQNNKKLSWEEKTYFARHILKMAERYHVDYRLVVSVIAVESSFRSKVVSSSGAIGLGQLKPGTARWMGVKDPYHPGQNIMGTARYLQYLSNRFRGNLSMTVAAYYQGPGAVSRGGISSAGYHYVSKVNRAVKRFLRG